MRTILRTIPTLMVLGACDPKIVGSLPVDEPQGQGNDEPGNSVTGGTDSLGPATTATTDGPGDDDTADATGTGTTGEPTDTRTVVQVGAHSVITCALLSDGAVRCWGSNEQGELGYGNTERIGDDEHPWAAGDVQLSGPATRIAVGGSHVCALLVGGSVQCWGYGDGAALGYGDRENIGDDETPATVGVIDLGEPALEIVAGWTHTCALLAGGRMRCWGDSAAGQLGYGNTEPIGDDETPASAGDVPVGGEVVDMSLGLQTTCAVLVGGDLRCWGNNYGHALGLAVAENIGDDEPASDAPLVDVGGPVVAVAAGASRTCVLLASGDVRCFGENWHESLGFGPLAVDCPQFGVCTGDPLCCVGDDETPASTPAIAIGAPVVALVGGGLGTCALTDTGGVRCWGTNRMGFMGRGDTPSHPECYPCNIDPHCCVGDDETVASLGDISLGDAAVQVSTGQSYGCIVTPTGGVRCWGYNLEGELGLAVGEDVGDDELPSSFPPVQVVHP